MAEKNRRVRGVLVIAAIAFMATGTATTAWSRNLGTVGATYPVAERDALEEIEQRVKSFNWKPELEKLQKQIRSFEANGVSLPVARVSRIFEVNPAYTLQYDITDEKGKIVYPKGYSFNPLEYMLIPLKPIVVIDGSDRRQVEWFKKSKQYREMGTMLLVAGGSPYKLRNELGRPVWVADRAMVTRFGLKAVPSIARQEGKKIRVEEIEMASRK